MAFDAIAPYGGRRGRSGDVGRWEQNLIDDGGEVVVVPTVAEEQGERQQPRSVAVGL
jgi:hypothetical protein